MNTQSRTSPGSLLLMELLIAVLVFSLSAAVCVQLFVTADRLSRNSQAESQAVLWGRSAAECYWAAGGDLEETADLLRELEALPQGREDGLELSFVMEEGTWVPCPAEEAEYVLRLTVQSAGEGLYSARLEAAEAGGGVIYTQQASALDLGEEGTP